MPSKKEQSVAQMCKQAWEKEVETLHTQFTDALRLHQKRDIHSAKLIYQSILEINPNYFDALHMLGVIYLQIGEAQKAVELISKAIKVNSRESVAFYNLGNAYRKLKKNQEAIRSYDQAILLKKNFVDAHHNQGALLLEQKQPKLAIQSLNRALAIDPTDAHIYYNRGNALKALGDYLGALSSYEKALALKPDYDFLLGRILMLKLQIADWDRLEERAEEMFRRVEEGKRVATPFTMLALSNSPELQKKAAEIWVKAMCPPDNRLGPIKKYVGHQKIRLGYFSADFREHAVSYLTAELFELHDRSKFEVFAFSFGANTNDPMQQRLRKGFDHFIEVGDKTDLEIALLARQMEIDIAIDLGGFTQDSRTGIFALRAAPIQVSYLGYLGTMGAPYVDYLIADEVLIPPKMRKYYSEKIIYLSNYQVNDSKRRASERVFSRAELGLPEEGFVFGCLNNNYKITPMIFDVWMKILKEVNESVLFLYVDNELAKDNLRIEAEKRGVSLERIIFAKRRPRDEYLAQYRLIDLFLDTFPYGAGTTASDALWMGVPILIFVGEGFPSRIGLSVCKYLGVSELVSNSIDSYAYNAGSLASTPSMMLKIKSKLCDGKLKYHFSPFALGIEELESAYLSIK